MYIQVELYVLLQPSFCCQLKQTRSLLLGIVVQNVIVSLYIIIKWVDNFKDEAHAKKHKKFGF